MGTLMVMGVDSHLDTVAAAVVDANGAQVALLEAKNTEVGWSELVRLCVVHEVSTVGIEGASGYGRRLAQTMVGAGLEVKEVPTRLTASTRRVDGAGKTDPGDARTIARAVARGEGNRWVDDPALETLRVVSNRRDQLVRLQTAEINQLRALLAEVDPDAAAEMPSLRSRHQFVALTSFEAAGDVHREMVAQLVRDLAEGCLARWGQINRLGRQLDELMPEAGRRIIDTIPGAGVVATAQLLAELAGTGGFATEAGMAAWAGIAPLDASSGRQQRHRLNRGGNRQANKVIHLIVTTQLKPGGEAAAYVARRMSEGKTKKEAIRAAKRYVIRRIWRTLNTTELT
jgi:transposase